MHFHCNIILISRTVEDRFLSEQSVSLNMKNKIPVKDFQFLSFKKNGKIVSANKSEMFLKFSTCNISGSDKLRYVDIMYKRNKTSDPINVTYLHFVGFSHKQNYKIKIIVTQFYLLLE